MRVKVGDQVYDSNEVPIMVVLSKRDKFNIEHMPAPNERYASFPTSWGTQEEMEEWVKKDIYA